MALDILAHGMDLVADDAGVGLVPRAPKALLEVRYTFQHTLEAAEPEMAVPPPPTPVPVPARAAFGSRLVFAVEPTDRIEYSVEGVLAAMSRLPLVVVPLATPRAFPRRFRITDYAGVVSSVVLPGGVRLLRTSVGLVLAPAAAQRGSRAPVRGRALIATATSLRTARALLASERAVDLSGLDLGTGGTGLGELTFRPPLIRPVRSAPRSPRPDETSIEAPFRLLISPSVLGGFAHAIAPAAVAPDPAAREIPSGWSCGTAGWACVAWPTTGSSRSTRPATRRRPSGRSGPATSTSPAPDVIGFLASLKGAEPGEPRAPERRSADRTAAAGRGRPALPQSPSARGWSCTGGGRPRPTRRGRPAHRGLGPRGDQRP